MTKLRKLLSGKAEIHVGICMTPVTGLDAASHKISTVRRWLKELSTEESINMTAGVYAGVSPDSVSKPPFPFNQLLHVRLSYQKRVNCFILKQT